MADLPLNEELVARNSKFEPYGTLTNREVASIFAEYLGVEAFSGDFPTQSGAVLLAVADMLPNEYKWGRIKEDGIVENEALKYLDPLPYLEAARDEGKLKKIPEDKVADVFSKAGAYAETELALTRSGAGPMPTPIAGNEDWSPNVSTETAQEFVLRSLNTTLDDLQFDSTLKFGFNGFLVGQNLGPEGGYSGTEARQFLYDLSPDQLSDLQIALRDAGYFDRVGGMFSIPGDYRDENTRLAWDYFLVDVVAAGPDAKPQDVLNDRIAMMQGELQSVSGFVPKDIATLRSLANDFGRALVGRRLDDAELNAFIAKAREWETEGAQAMTFAREQQSVDINARAEAYFNDQLAIEVAKNGLWEWAGRFN